MLNQQTLEGQWNVIKGRLRHRWGQLTNDDLARFDGDFEQLIGLIQRKTGETREAIEDFLSQLTEDGASGVRQAIDDVRNGFRHAAERVHESSEQAAEYLRQGFGEAREMVRTRPGESVLVCFAAGLATGLLIALLARRR
jgi:uncharacterized protein YjbJ (UPF0337 family)